MNVIEFIIFLIVHLKYPFLNIFHNIQSKNDMYAPPLPSANPHFLKVRDVRDWNSNSQFKWIQCRVTGSKYWLDSMSSANSFLWFDWIALTNRISDVEGVLCHSRWESITLSICRILSFISSPVHVFDVLSSVIKMNVIYHFWNGHIWILLFVWNGDNPQFNPQYFCNKIHFTSSRHKYAMVLT